MLERVGDVRDVIGVGEEEGFKEEVCERTEVCEEECD